MKKVTVECFCDICGEPIERNKVRTITLPRRVKYYAKTGSNITLATWDTVRYVNTDICDACGNTLADTLPIVADDEDTGYAE